MPDPITRLNAALEGRYRIERELGEGGMATVYLADDLKHERRVALKAVLLAFVGLTACSEGTTRPDSSTSSRSLRPNPPRINPERQQDRAYDHYAFHADAEPGDLSFQLPAPYLPSPRPPSCDLRQASVGRHRGGR